MVNRANVKRLVAAAWRGMEEELAVQNASAEDVVNATVAIAAGGINYACSAAAGETPEAIAHNKAAVRDTLYQLLMNTSSETVN
jgi:hypothetical protein